MKAEQLARLVASSLLIVAAIAVPLLTMNDPLLKRATALAGACLVLWISELIPLYATTMLLIAGVALLLSPLNPKEFGLASVLRWSAQPVMALFFGGFALSVAGSKYGIDAHIASWLLRVSRGRRAALLAAIMGGTALLSMWMSNIAAAAMMIATLRPLLASQNHGGSFRTALLLGIAFAANFGGMGTPLGTGPNLIAIGAVADQYRITFLQWMTFGVPLCVVMVLLAYALIALGYRVRGRAEVRIDSLQLRAMTTRSWLVVALFFAAVLAWLTEPLHGVAAAVVALALAAVLFATRLLDTADLAKLEWETLMLIAGGLTLGELFERSGLARAMAGMVEWSALPPIVLVLAFVFTCATLSAVASNTAAAAMLIQIGLSIVPTPSFAVLVALGASMGVPFVISTPPNAMIYGQGGIRPRDLALPGLVLMLVGCMLLAALGPPVLHALRVP